MTTFLEPSDSVLDRFAAFRTPKITNGSVVE